MKKFEFTRDFYVNVLEILAPKTKIDILAWIFLYKKYGTDIFYFLNLMAGQTIKVPSFRTIVEAIKTVKAKKDYPETIEILVPEDTDDKIND